MAKVKDTDFKTTKKRPGREQLRKYKSLDDKLLSDLSRVKKTVKVSTQSITINKDSLNVTSRRLTFPELVGKSRHTSENVRNHALIGLTEFIRRYEEEGRLNVYILLQVSCSSLLSESSQLRISSRNLLLSILSTYFSNYQSCSKKFSEMIYLYLIQGSLTGTSSSDPSYCDDVYALTSLVLDRYPWVLKGYYENLLRSFLENTPESLSFRHFNCVYTLFKQSELDRNTHNELLEYAINVQYKLITNTNPLVRPDRTTKVSKRTEDRSSSLRVSNEIECLTSSSMVVKSLKLILSSSDSVKNNDSRLVDLLLTMDLFESENMTDKGKETFERLYSEFVLTKAELALKLLPLFTKHHLALYAPLLQMESLKGRFEPSRVVEILFKAISLTLRSNMSFQMKAEWTNKILNVMSESNLTNIALFKAHLQDLKNGNQRLNRFNELEKDSDGHLQYPFGSDGDYRSDKEHDKEVELGKLRGSLLDLYCEVMDSLLESVLGSPAVWPFLSLVKGVSPVLFPKIFTKSHHWSYLNNAKLVGNNSLQFGSGFHLSGELGGSWDPNFDFEEVMSNFASGSKTGLMQIFLNYCLHISKRNNRCEFYYKLPDIPGYYDEHYQTLSRLFLNLPSSTRLNEFLSQLVLNLFSKGRFEAVREFINVLLFHVFNSDGGGRLDSQGRVLINFDATKELLDKVEYFMRFYMKFVETLYNSSLPDPSRTSKVPVTTGNTDKNKEDGKKGTVENPDNWREGTNSTLDGLVYHALKLLIDKYLMAMCNIEGNDDFSNTIHGFLNQSLKAHFQGIHTNFLKRTFRVLNDVMAEYMDKDSIPEWITVESK